MILLHVCMQHDTHDARKNPKCSNLSISKPTIPQPHHGDEHKSYGEVFFFPID